jgi:hypothetical protein
VVSPGVRCFNEESRTLEVVRKMGGNRHLKLNIDTRPIANKYCEGKVKRTLERELKVPENAQMEANETSFCARDCCWLWPAMCSCVGVNTSWALRHIFPTLRFLVGSTVRFSTFASTWECGRVLVCCNRCGSLTDS